MSSSVPASAPPHAWRFFSAGGLDQVRLESAADFAALGSLDPKLWVALSCPATGLEFDAQTLALVDTDKDGRIRVPEILAAVRWAAEHLKNPADLAPRHESLPLAAINDAHDSGKKLLAAAREILRQLGKADATVITVADTTDTAKVFTQARFNGDGVVPAASAGDEETRKLIEDILATVGGEPDRSGVPGVSQARLDAFFAELQAHADWHAKAQANVAEILPLSDATPAALAALKAVRAKMDDYFTRCRLAAFDPRAAAPLNRAEAEFAALAVKDFSASAGEVSAFPLARIEAGRALPLRDGVNPAWTAAMEIFRASAVAPLLGADKTSLTHEEWLVLNAKFAAHEAWLAARAGGAVEKLGLARITEILGGAGRDAVAKLIAQDVSLQAEFAAMADVDKLVRFHRDLHRLLCNFVNFADFYSGKGKAVFQAGTLYLDQRSCELCIPVEDAGRHAAMAGLTGTYLAYVDCARKATGEKRQIVAAITGGDSDHLMVGRNGVFYDRQGRDWDATVTKIIENPISIRQAFWSPYKKLVRLIEEQVAKRAAAADAEATGKLSTAATAVANVDKAKPAEPKKMDVGTVAALGVALGSLGTAFGYVLATFASVKDWQLPLLFAAVMLAISGPSMLIAYLKLRKRNLGPILDANGWAVNARAKINVPFGGALTQTAALPLGARLDAQDAFAERRSAWPRVLAVLFLAWWAYAYLNTEGYLYSWTNGDWGKNPDARPRKEAAGTNAPPAATVTNAPPAK